MNIAPRKPVDQTVPADTNLTVPTPFPGERRIIQAAEAQVAAEWKVGDVILDFYEVKHVFEGGGMGLVYRVHHRDWNTDLAVKSPRRDYFKTETQKENFTRECETWINLGLHPHVVSCHYVRTLGGIPRVFAEYVEGGTLKEWIDSRKLYEGGEQGSLKRILDVAIQMAWGLHYAHEQGVIHQDVKPANVLMMPDGMAKITDFGLAKARAASGDPVAVGAGRSILVSSGGMTPAYCSPEQVNRQELSRKTDIWSWAVSVLEMFVGEVCWQSGTAAPEVLKRLSEVRPEGVEIPEMPEGLRELLQVCFDSNPARRPKDASEVSCSLAKIYRTHLNEDYVRPEPAGAELRADALNNQALSLLDLAKPEEALGVFNQALVEEPGHPECLYNRGLLLWRRGQVTDQALLALLLEHATAQTDTSSRDKYLMGLVHLERGDSETALKLLEEVCARDEPSLEAKTALELARTLARRSTNIRMFEGHKLRLTSVALSSDGLWALSGSHDKTLRLWELATGRCARIFEGHTDSVSAVALSDDGRLALSGSSDKTLRLWEVATGRCLRIFQGHEEEVEQVTSVALSADGRWALSGARPRRRDGVTLEDKLRMAEISRQDHTLRLWEVASGRCARDLDEHSAVRAVAISTDARWALVAIGDPDWVSSEACALQWWDLASGRCVRILDQHTPFRSLALSANGRWAVSGGRDCRLWELATGRCVRTFGTHGDHADSVSVSADGRWVVSGGKTLRLWDAATGRCLRTFEDHTNGVGSVALSADGRRALSSSGPTLSFRELPIFSPSSWMLARPRSSREHLQRESLFRSCLQRGLESQNRQEWPQAVAAAREALNCEGYSRAPEAFDLLNRTNQHGKRLQLRNGFCRVLLSGCAGRFALSPDGLWLLWPSEDNSVRLSELVSGRCVRTFEGHTKVVKAVAFSDDGRWALSGSDDNTFRLWEVASGHGVRVFEGKAEKVLSVAPSTDGRWWVLSEVRDSHDLHLWEAASGRCARTIKGHRKDVWSAALSTDERWVLSYGDDNDRTIRLWEVASGRCVRTFAGPPLRRPVHSAVFSADGLWAVSGSGGFGKDNAVRLWEVATGGCVRAFEGHTDSVRSVAFSRDGRWVLSGSDDRTLRLWEVATGRCVRIFEGHTNAVYHVALSADGRWALSRSSDGTLRLWELDWECEFPDVAAWDEGARPYLGLFLTLHCPVGSDGLTRSGRPVWTDEEFQTLLTDLQCCGYGWLRPEGVRRQLEKMTAEWQGPPPLPGNATTDPSCSPK